MSPVQFLRILCDSPFLPPYEKLESLMILIDHYRATGTYPVSQNELVLVHG